MALLDRAAICRRIAQARDEAGLTQQEMADAFGVHKRTIQNWETGEVSKKTGERNWPVPFDHLDDIAVFTGVSKEWLWRGDEAATEFRTGGKILEEIGELRGALDLLQGAIREALAEVRRGQSPQDEPRSAEPA